MANHTIATGTTLFNGTTQGVNPGDTIRVQNSSGRDYLKITEVVGTAIAPVRIVNWQGQVVIDALTNGRSYCLEIDESDYVILDGWGHALAWGFRLEGFTNTGLWIHDETEHIEVYGFEITEDDPENGGAAVRAGTRLTEASPGFIVDDIEIRDCWFHDIFQEALYAGNDSIDSQYPIDGLVVQFNRFINCGWAGAQIRNATNVNCFRNEIAGCGTDVDEGHAGGGLNVGSNTSDQMSGDWHHLTIRDCERGIHGLTDDADINLHHILIEDCGLAGGPHDPQGGFKFQNGVEAGFVVSNLTVIDNSPGGTLYGVKSKSGDTNGEFLNCIIAGSMTDYFDSDWDDTNNEKTSVAAQNFGEEYYYHLTGSSPDAVCGWLPWI